MAPSRGPIPSPPSTTPSPPSNKPTSSTSSSPDDDLALTQQSTSALTAFRRNFAFFLHPTTTPATAQPTRLRTRALLRSARYLTTFILWRLVRWAKYAAIAAISATAIGSVVSGVAWIAAPTGIGASILAATIWGTGKFIARRLNKRWQRSGGDAGIVAREREEDEGVRRRERREALLGQEVGEGAVPW